MIFVSHDSTRRLARVASALGLALASAGLGIAGEGCLLINQDHCALNQGSCPEGLVCDECAASNNGCVAEALDGCAFNPTDSGTTTPATTGETTQSETTVGPATTEDQPTDPTTETTTDGTTDGTTETTGVPSCDPETPELGCGDSSAPYCVATDVCGQCSELVSKSCSDIDSASPACDASSGFCVECTTSDLAACSNPNAAICNPYVLECSPCFEHDQCASMACNIESGMCFPDQEDKIIWVHNRENCAVEDGSEENPYCSLADAFSQKALPQQSITFKVLDGGEMFPQSDPLSIVGDYIVSIVNGEPDGEPKPRFRTTDSENSALFIDVGAHVFIDGLRFDGNPQAIAQPMITINGGMSRLYIDRSELTNNNSLAWVNGGEVHVRRTTIYDNAEGVLVTGGTLLIENSYFAHNGTPNATEGMPPGTNKYAPLRVNGGGAVMVTYTTFVANSSLFASVLDCIGVNNVDNSRIRNSVLIGKTPLEQNGLNMGCGSVIDPETNLQIAYPQMLAEVDLSDIFADEPMDGGIYRALEGGELMGLTMRNPEDPYMDYDGDARSLDDESNDYAGADIP